jgi:hypothetical protein
VSRREHYEECAHFIEGRQGEDIIRRAEEMEQEGLHPHFHVWEPITFAGFLAALDLPFLLESIQASTDEFIVILRKPANQGRMGPAGLEPATH